MNADGRLGWTLVGDKATTNCPQLGIGDIRGMFERKGWVVQGEEGHLGRHYWEQDGRSLSRWQKEKDAGNREVQMI